MDQASFEAGLRSDGFEVASRSLPAGDTTTPHSHPFDVRALVTAGDITLTVDGVATRYAAGQVFTMAAGCEHAEAVGSEGVSYMAGRKEG